MVQGYRGQDQTKFRDEARFDSNRIERKIEMLVVFFDEDRIRLKRFKSFNAFKRYGDRKAPIKKCKHNSELRKRDFQK